MKCSEKLGICVSVPSEGAASLLFPVLWGGWSDEDPGERCGEVTLWVEDVRQAKMGLAMSGKEYSVHLSTRMASRGVDNAWLALAASK